MLLPNDFTVGMLLSNLRRDLELEDEQSLFIFAHENGKQSRILRTGNRIVTNRRLDIEGLC